MKPRKTAVLILSADYSGSTWLGYVLGSHADSAFLGEYYRAWRKGLGTPCTVCAAKGLAECEVLHGIERVPVEQAFAWAFERTGRRVLVDSSKVTDWAAQAIENKGDFDIRLLHLVRDPRGWFASQRRRTPTLSPGATLPGWIECNAAIRAFVERANTPSRTLLYDDFAANPHESFRALFVFCGLEFSPESLEYWRFAHHGFAANGATSPLIADSLPRQRIPQFITRDDEFYRKQRRSQFADDRWRTELRPDMVEELSSDSQVGAFLRSIGKRLTPTGVTDGAAPASRRPSGRAYAQWASLLRGRH